MCAVQPLRTRPYDLEWIESQPNHPKQGVGGQGYAYRYTKASGQIAAAATEFSVHCVGISDQVIRVTALLVLAAVGTMVVVPVVVPV